MKILVAFLLVMVCLLSSCQAARLVKVSPEYSDEPLINPGKGWVLTSDRKLLDNLNKDVFKWAKINCVNLHWYELEPNEGEYNWKLIDGYIDECKKFGLRLSLRMQNANSGDSHMYVTPKWVFDAGAKGVFIKAGSVNKWGSKTYYDQVIPIFDDAVYLQKFSNFINAFAKRYDGNPNLAHIDIRSYGNWGEGHLSPWLTITPEIKEISPEKLLEHILIWQSAIKKTPLCLPYGTSTYDSIYDIAVSKGIWIRRDGICGNSEGEETLRCYPHVPGVFEFYQEVESMITEGWWYKKDVNGKIIGVKLWDYVENGRPSYINFGNGYDDSVFFLNTQMETINKLSNRMGYHFSLVEMEYPALIKKGITSQIKAIWLNDGCAPIYIPAYTAFALIDKNGKEAARCITRSSNPAKWASDKETTENIKIVFNKAKPGSYKLAVGLLENTKAVNPTIKLGVNLPIINGWYELGDVKVR
jgi:hypothetical protein